MIWNEILCIGDSITYGARDEYGRTFTAELSKMLTEETDQGFLCPDLILLDINMPIVNGWEFMDKYQSLSAEQKAKIVVVMLTTSLNPDDRSRAESIKDIKDFVSKPLDETTLKDIIEKHFN